MPDYSKSKIYKIYCNLTGETYYGSTVQPLHKRVNAHKISFNLWKNGKSNYVKSYDIIERGDYDYSLVQNYPCDSKEELHARERYWIENNQCVNKVIPSRTVKEYYEDNKEHILEYNKEWREQNKEKVAQINKEWREQNKEKVAEQHKEWREQNKEKISERRKEWGEVKAVCDCGSVVRKDGLCNHKKTKKHLAWVESQE